MTKFPFEKDLISLYDKMNWVVASKQISFSNFTTGFRVGQTISCEV